MLFGLGLMATACVPPPPEPSSSGACDPGTRFDGANPIATGGGQVRSVYATSDAGADVAAASVLFVRVEFADEAVPHLLFLDTDGDRWSGMWTYQSSVSSNAWNLLVDETATLLRHEGPPTQWSWTPAGAGPIERRTAGAVSDLCIPVDAIGRPQRVRLSAMARDEWAPAPFLRGATFPADEQPEAPRASQPDRLAFHYGARPWRVRGCGDPAPSTMDCAARVYARFRHVVLGAGLEEPDAPTRDLTRAFVAAVRERSPETEVWGYVSLIGSAVDGDGYRDAVWSIDDIGHAARRWKTLGVTGIFVDEANLCLPEADQPCPVAPDGTPVPITRQRQLDAVAAIRGLGLRVFANAFSPFDVLADAGGAGSPLIAGDMYLLENPTVALGQPLDGLDLAASEARFASAHELARRLGVRLAAVDTASGSPGDRADDELYRKAWARAAAWGVDAYGFTNGVYSASGEAERNLPVLGAPPES